MLVSHCLPEAMDQLTFLGASRSFYEVVCTVDKQTVKIGTLLLSSPLLPPTPPSNTYGHKAVCNPGYSQLMWQ